MKGTLIKPIVSSNLAISLDGKIASATREFFSLGSKRDLALLSQLRSENDIVLSGASTLRAFKGPWHTTKSKATNQPANAVLTRALEGLLPSWDFFSKPKKQPLVFYTEALSTKTTRLFSKKAQLIKLDKKKPLAKQIIEACQLNGYQRILVEGGGSVMWEFVKDSLIDYYYVTLTPTLLGGKAAPSLVEGTGFSAQSRLKLKLEQAKVVGDEIFLVYRPKTS